jgi:hypothetical protein
MARWRRYKGRVPGDHTGAGTGNSDGRAEGHRFGRLPHDLTRPTGAKERHHGSVYTGRGSRLSGAGGTAV